MIKYCKLGRLTCILVLASAILGTRPATADEQCGLGLGPILASGASEAELEEYAIQNVDPSTDNELAALMADGHNIATSLLWRCAGHETDLSQEWRGNGHWTGVSLYWERLLGHFAFVSQIWLRDGHSILTSLEWIRDGHEYGWSTDGHLTGLSQAWRDVGHIEPVSRVWIRAGHQIAPSQVWERNGHILGWSLDGHITQTSSHWIQIGHHYDRSRSAWQACAETSRPELRSNVGRVRGSQAWAIQRSAAQGPAQNCAVQ